MSQSLTGAKQRPLVAWEYWGWCDTLKKHGCLYGLDNKRTDAHDRLCAHYKIRKERSKKVTDHLDKYSDAVEMHFALVKLKESEGEK